MSKEDIIDITPDADEPPKDEPPKVEPPKKEAKPGERSGRKRNPQPKNAPKRTAKEAAMMGMPKVDNSGNTPVFFARFGGKAPHYKLASTFSLENISRSDQDDCRLFTSWMKPKRVRLSCEWAEKMRAMGNLIRLELPGEDF